MLSGTSSPNDVRQRCRKGLWMGPTAGLADGYAQANLVMLPKKNAYDFLLFCQRNPKPCPLLEVLDEGSFQPKKTVKSGQESDIRTDVPLYRIFRDGKMVEEVSDVRPYWREDLVTFLIGCSFTFEGALMQAGLGVRHIEMKKNVPMYRTNVQCERAGDFSGPLVVSMRPYLPSQLSDAVRITSRFSRVHGAPVHIGDPASLGIADIGKPDYGEAVDVRQGEVPVFWACGVTPQAAAVASGIEFMITHAPGCMFVTDLKDEEIALWG